MRKIFVCLCVSHLYTHIYIPTYYIYTLHITYVTDMCMYIFVYMNKIALDKVSRRTIQETNILTCSDIVRPENDRKKTVQFLKFIFYLY